MDAVRRLALGIVGMALLACTDATVEVAARKKLAWPFSEQSIWNMPIGGNARYVPASLTGVSSVALTSSFLVLTTAQDPQRPLLAPGDGPDRCAGTRMLDMIRVPDSFVLTAGQNSSPGNSTSFVQPDGNTLIEVAGLARCTAAGPVFGFRFGTSDLLGDGRLGGQGGSGLSSLGGSLMQGQLVNGQPVRHALKVSLPARLYFHDPTIPDSCFRWPADRCDNAHADPGDGMYRGTNPEFKMGALLAVRPDQELPMLKTQAGRLMFEALRDYGAYVVGTSGGNDIARWIITSTARAAFEAALGDDFAVWQEDVKAILPLLQVVANNGPASVGGGGAPRAPLAPPIGD